MAALAALATAPPSGAGVATSTAAASAPGPPQALRTSIVLDRATLESWGVASPSRLAFDAEGSLYLLDVSRRRLVKIDPEGRFQHEVALGGGDAASQALPADLVIDARGSVLLLDRSQGALLAYDKSGALLTARSLAPDLVEDARDPGASLLLDGFGRLWLVAPRERDLVRLNEALGRDRAGRFLTPEDSVGVPRIAATLPNGDAWVADAASGTIRRYRASGALSGSVALSDSGSASSVAGLAADRWGHLYVADAGAQRIVALGADGLRRAERVLGGAERRWRPGAIAWSPLDRIAVADSKRGEVQILVVEREAPR